MNLGYLGGILNVPERSGGSGLASGPGLGMLFPLARAGGRAVYFSDPEPAPERAELNYALSAQEEPHQAQENDRFSRSDAYEGRPENHQPQAAHGSACECRRQVDVMHRCFGVVDGVENDLHGRPAGRPILFLGSAVGIRLHWIMMPTERHADTARAIVP